MGLTSEVPAFRHPGGKQRCKERALTGNGRIRTCRLPDGTQDESSMPFTELKIHAAHGVLAVPVDQLAPRDEQADRALVAAFSSEYNHAALPKAVPPDEEPPLILESRGGPLVFTRVQADLEVQFYGGHQTSAELCRNYFGDKMLRLLKVWQEVGAQPVWATIVIALKAPFEEGSDNPGAHLRDTYLSDGLADSAVHDVKAQLGIRVAEHYFVNLAVSPYEAKQVTRTGTSNSVTGVIRPWEGDITETGIDLNVEVNNRLRANVLRQHSRVDADELREMNDLSWDLVAHTATPFIRDGQLDLSRVQAMAL